MKNIVRFCLMILCITCYSCDDPYKDTVFKVYDVQPAATYLQNRPDDFSEWVKVLKYGDLFNAVNRAEDAFTVLAPTNDALLSKIWDMNMPALLLHIMSSMTPLIGRIL